MIAIEGFPVGFWVNCSTRWASVLESPDKFQLSTKSWVPGPSSKVREQRKSSTLKEPAITKALWSWGVQNKRQGKEENICPSEVFLRVLCKSSSRSSSAPLARLLRIRVVCCVEKFDSEKEKKVRLFFVFFFLFRPFFSSSLSFKRYTRRQTTKEKRKSRDTRGRSRAKETTTTAKEQRQKSSLSLSSPQKLRAQRERERERERETEREQKRKREELPLYYW